MNKTQLIDAISDKTNLSKIQVKLVLNSMLETITNSLRNGDMVQMVGFGTFKVNHRSARPGRNPQTGEEIYISASKVPAFVSGKTLKNAIK